MEACGVLECVGAVVQIVALANSNEDMEVMREQSRPAAYFKFTFVISDLQSSSCHIGRLIVFVSTDWQQRVYLALPFCMNVGHQEHRSVNPRASGHWGKMEVPGEKIKWDRQPSLVEKNARVRQGVFLVCADAPLGHLRFHFITFWRVNSVVILFLV